jgi:beta-lactamase class A
MANAARADHALVPWIVAVCLPFLTGADQAAVEQKIAKAAEAVEGRHAFLVTELTDKGPVALYAVDTKERFAVGSSFKLYILGALID